MGTSRVDRQESKRSVKARTDRGAVVTTSIVTSVLCKKFPEVLSACEDLGQASVALGEAEKALLEAEAAWMLARLVRDGKLVAYDSALNVAVATVERVATSEAEIAGTGLVVLERASYEIAAPVSVSARWNASKGRLFIVVKTAPGIKSCIVDISAGAAAPTTWQRLPGISVRPSVSGLEPGVYWVRAAGVRGAEQSPFTVPISVIVKPA